MLTVGSPAGFYRHPAGELWQPTSCCSTQTHAGTLMISINLLHGYFVCETLFAEWVLLVSGSQQAQSYCSCNIPAMCLLASKMFYSFLGPGILLDRVKTRTNASISPSACIPQPHPSPCLVLSLRLLYAVPSSVLTGLTHRTRVQHCCMALPLAFHVNRLDRSHRMLETRFKRDTQPLWT